ncbi:alpha/beta fold hydrolase [Janthinobacterium sp. 1_2014MBL_MicDiv]|uniref:alpha/beta fold hydrolase n=1 Tax=Janthinobacterium sp. 1_2014MBL_MicDiv TaxID=1644131 RepID=UPI0008F4D472|nr:alpha/beta hydrolase [Janthinobacterium sp. 1_2014MBL_MicDiv]APA67340.1 alpha/beta hydrolase [Janthinobacterium sp. 1_2014MBL_MicDiv]
MKLSRSEFINIRGARTHVRHWGREGAPILFMVHGWMDVAASFQFVVDELAGDWHVIAPDWRGFGLSDYTQSDTYWFPDYLADLDAMLLHYSPDAPVKLLGHSMGANVAGLYAGVRPERISRFINLEGFGMMATKPEQAPGRYAKWLDELREPPVMRSYPTQKAVAERLQKTNPRLPDARAAFLAEHWSARNEAGEWDILGDPLHKRVNPILYQVEEVMACWRRITAPVLWVEADDTNMWQWMGPKEEARIEIDRRLACIKDVRCEMLNDAGHMLHHDQPAALARLVEAFLA